MGEEGKQAFSGPSQSNLIGGRYLLHQPLGRGSFGQVFLAEDVNFEPPRKVAIKILHQQFLNEPAVREDIKREASTLARFHHPNILRVIDFSVTPELAYIVTDLAEGGSLATKLRPDPTKAPIRMPLEEVAWYLEQMADAIDEAHSEGLLHRDIKPLNILLDKRGRPLVADFGLATAISNSQSSSVLMDVSTSGTPPYMAPEQWRGQVSRASDIYALAVLTYQMVTGQLPFQGSQFELMGQHLQEPVPLLSFRAPDLKYPPILDEVIARAMAKDPKQRTRPALEFYRRFKVAFASVINPKPPIAEPVPTELLPTEVTNPPALPASIPPDSSKPENSPIHPTNRDISNLDEKTAPPLVAAPSLATSPAKPANFKFLLIPAVIVSLILIIFVLSNVILHNEFARHNGAVNEVAFSPDGKTLASASTDNTIKLWEVASGKEVTTLNSNSGHAYSVAFSPDGKTLASGNEDNTVKLWDIASGKIVATLNAHTSIVISVAFSPDGKTLASSSFDFTAKLWEVASGKVVHGFNDHSSVVTSVAFSPDGKLLASASGDNTVKFWDVTSSKEVATATLKGHSNEVTSVAFSPDGRTLASGSFDQTIKLWEVASDKVVTTLKGHSNVVLSVAFSPDGKLLASASADKTIKLWDVTSGKEVATFNGHSSEVTSVAFSPDGKTLASGSYDKTIKLWDVSKVTKP